MISYPSCESVHVWSGEPEDMVPLCEIGSVTEVPWKVAFTAIDSAYSKLSSDSEALLWLLRWTRGSGPEVCIGLMRRAIWRAMCEDVVAFKAYVQMTTLAAPDAIEERS